MLHPLSFDSLFSYSKLSFLSSFPSFAVLPKHFILFIALLWIQCSLPTTPTAHAKKRDEVLEQKSNPVLFKRKTSPLQVLSINHCTLQNTRALLLRQHFTDSQFVIHDNSRSFLPHCCPDRYSSLCICTFDFSLKCSSSHCFHWISFWLTVQFF